MKDIYDKMFDNPNYNKPGQIQYTFVKNECVKRKPSSILDIGSGRGNFLREVHQVLPETKIHSCDLDNYHNLDFVDSFQTINLCEEKDVIKGKYDMVTCLDCLEHLTYDAINGVIEKIANVTIHNAIFTIANHSDIINGVELHLIREGTVYWNNLLSKYFNIDYEEVLLNGRLMYYILSK